MCCVFLHSAHQKLMCLLAMWQSNQSTTLPCAHCNVARIRLSSRVNKCKGLCEPDLRLMLRRICNCKLKTIFYHRDSEKWGAFWMMQNQLLKPCHNYVIVQINRWLKKTRWLKSKQGLLVPGHQQVYLALVYLAPQKWHRCLVLLSFYIYRISEVWYALGTVISRDLWQWHHR